MTRTDIETLVNEFKGLSGPNDRYSSFDYCYNYFRTTNQGAFHCKHSVNPVCFSITISPSFKVSPKCSENFESSVILFAFSFLFVRQNGGEAALPDPLCNRCRNYGHCQESKPASP